MSKTKLKIKVTGKTGKKKKAKLVKNTKTGVEQAETMLQELSLLHSEIEVMKAKLAEKTEPLKAKEEEFIDLVDMDIEAKDKIIVTDGTYTINVGARTKTRVVEDNDKAILALEEVKPGLALESFKPPMKILDTYLTPEVIESFIGTKLGNRRLTYKG